MHLLRRVVRFCLGAEAIVLLGAFVLILATIAMVGHNMVDEDTPLSSFGVVIFAALMFPLLAALPAIAWWMLRKGKPSARRWAKAASVLNVLVLLAGIDMLRHVGHLGTFPFYVFCGAIGFLGLIAFWRDDSRSGAKPVRIAGDGTSKINEYAAQAVAIAIIWFSMDCWSRWAHSHHLSYPGLWTFLAQMEIAVLLTTFGHELGHLIAGWASGKILRSFHVGPIQWAIRNGVSRFSFNMRKFYGGSVGMVSPDLRNIRSSKAFFVIGGPVASLVMGAVCIVLALLTPRTSWQQDWLLFSMMANFSIAAFVVNLMPLKPESNYSDGAQLYQIVTNGPWARVHLAFAMVGTSIVSRVRPRDFDVSLINKAADSVPKGDRGLLLRLFACLHYVDSGEISKAMVSLEAAEALYEGSIFERPQDICAEFVFLNAFHKRDLAAADLWSKRIDALRKIDHDADYWRARTSLHWLRGDWADALAAWERGNALALKLPQAGSYDFTRSCFAKLRAALNAPVPTTPPPLESLISLASACKAAEVPVAVEA